MGDTEAMVAFENGPRQNTNLIDPQSQAVQPKQKTSLEDSLKIDTVIEDDDEGAGINMPSQSR